jgi:hypothetical protein
MSRDSDAPKGSGPVRRPLWIARRDRDGWTGFLAVGGALAVFSFKEEAQMYLRVGAPAGRWRVEKTEPGELASMLLGPCSGAERVALDPMPEVGARAVVRLVSISRESFLGLLMGEPTGEPEDARRQQAKRDQARDTSLGQRGLRC